MEFLDGAGIDDAWGMAKWRNLCVWQLSETRRDGSNVQVTRAVEDIYHSMLVCCVHLASRLLTNGTHGTQSLQQLLWADKHHCVWFAGGCLLQTTADRKRYVHLAALHLRNRC